MGQTNNKHKYESDDFNDTSPNPYVGEMQMPVPISNDGNKSTPSSKIDSSLVNEGYPLENQSPSSFTTKNIFSGGCGEHKLGGQVYAIAYSPDGKTIAVGEEDGNVILMDSVTMTEISVHERGDTVRAISYSPDGKTIAVGGDDKKVDILRSETLNVVKEHELEGYISAMAFLSDGKHLVVGRDDGIVSIHNTSTLEAVTEYSLGCAVNAVAVSPDNQTMAVGGDDGNVVLLKVPKLNSQDPSLSMWKEHKSEGAVFAVVFSPNGKYIAIGGGDSKVVMLHSSTLKVVEVYQQDDCVLAVAFSRDGKYLALGGFDRKLAILSTLTWEVVKEYKREGDVFAVAFAPDSEIVAVGGKSKIETLDLPSVGIVYKYESDAQISKIALSPNGETLTIAGDDNKIRMLDIFTDTVQEHETDSNVTLIAYSPNSECIAFGDGKKIIIMSSLTKEVLFKHKLDDGIWTINYSPDGKFLVAGGKNKVLLLDTSSYVINTQELEGVGEVRAIAHSSDNALIAVGGTGKKVMILDASNFAVKKELPLEDYVLAIVFSLDNKNIVVGGRNKKVIIYETTAYYAVGEYNQGGEVNNITYTPDGKYITVETFTYVDNKTLVKKYGDKTLALLDPKNDLKQFGCPILVPERISSTSFYQGNNQASSADSYHIAVASGKSCAIINLHQHSYTPADVLLRTENDDEAIDFMKINPAPAYTRKEILKAAVRNKRPNIVRNLIQNDPSLAIQKDYVDNEESNKVLPYLHERHLLKELNEIADCGFFRTSTSQGQLAEMLKILRQLAETQNKTSVVKLLSSGEKDMTEGFVTAEEIYALKPSKNWRWVPSLFEWGKDDVKLLPLTSELPPRYSSVPPELDSTWKDLESDNDKRVRVKVLRVLLPGLASCDFLKSLIEMNDKDAFKSSAVIASIDVNWKSWARKIFRIQALFYSVWLVSFTIFCLISKDQIQPNNWGIHVLTAIMVCCVLHFMWQELRQFKGLRPSEYVKDPWNAWEWTSKATAILTIILTYSVSSSLRVIAITSATSLLLAWFRIFYFMLGFESCAWIVTVLYAIMMSMWSFLFVMGLIVFTFALSFHALYKGRGIDSYDVDSNDYIPPAFDSIGSAFQTAMFAGIYGDFDRQFVDELYSSTYALILLHVMLFIILVISLNTLIAYISDIYANIGSELGGKKMQRARIMIDMYSFLTAGDREKVEAEHRWTSLVIPVASLEVQASKAEEANFAKATKKGTKKLMMMMMNKAIAKDTDRIKEVMKGMKEDMKENNNGIREDIDGVKEDMKENNNGIREDIDGVKEDINGIKESIDAMMKLMISANEEK